MVIRGIFIGLFYLLSIPGRCQDRREIVQLSYIKKLHGVHYIPFNEVTVIDNRIDTTKLKVIPEGEYPIQELVFDQPASLAIADYIQRVVSGFPQTNRHLVIDLRQFRFGNIATRIGAERSQNSFHKPDPQIDKCLFVSAAAYYETSNGRLKRVLYFKKPIVLQEKGFRGDSYARTVIKALTDLLIELCSVDERRTSGDTLVSEKDLVGNNVTNDWANYPINRQSPVSNGIYPTFDDFLNNREQVMDFSLRMNVDSNYTLMLPAGVKSPWGVYTNGAFYLAFNDPYSPYTRRAFYLQLEKKNNTFYFYLPHDLPNMYAFLSATQMGTTPIGSNRVNSGNALAGALVSGIAAGTQISKNAATAARGENVTEMGMNSGWRRCFLDMDSGDIVY